MAGTSGRDVSPQRLHTPKGHPSRHSSNKLGTKVVLCCLTVCAVTAMVLQHYRELVDSYINLGNVEAKLDDFVTAPLLPKTERIDGFDHYYMYPEEGVPPEGLFIFLHSCRRSGLEFFHLPEDRIIAQDALLRGLVVFAPTSQHRESGCFTQMDIGWVEDVVGTWAANHDLVHLPRVGMASSSGASFLFFVYQSLKLRAMAVYNSPQGFPPQDFENDKVIPTAFVTMIQDHAISTAMVDNYENMKEAGALSRLFRVSPHPFTHALCLARFPEMKPKECAKIFERIQNDFPSLLDRDGFVLEGFKSGLWLELFQQLEFDSQRDSPYYKTEAASSGHSWTWAVVEEEIRACFGFHAITAEHHSSVMDFLVAEGGISPT